MKRGIFVAAVASLALLVWSWSTQGAAKERQGTTDLRGEHRVGSVALPAGQYLIVHREHAENHPAGEACFFFYHPANRSEKNEVARFSCRVSASEEKPQGLSVRTLKQPDGTLLITSVQFPGSREVHKLVPVAAADEMPEMDHMMH